MFLDLHNHTFYSPDSNMKPEHFLWLAKQKGIGLAITDHHTISAWPRLKEANKKYQVPLVYGEEIKILNKYNHCMGEVIGLFLQEQVKPGYYHDVLTDLRAQDAIISIAHPFDPLRKNCKVLQEIVHRVDCVEAFNSRMTWPGPNERAQEFIQKHRLAFTAGSDAHFDFEFGHAFIELKATDLEEARKEIKKGAVRFHGQLSNPIAHVFTHLCKFKLIQEDAWADPNEI